MGVMGTRLVLAHLEKEKAMSQKGKVLVVEDQPMLIKGMERILTSLGYQVLVASTLTDIERYFVGGEEIIGIIWDGLIIDGETFVGDGPGTIRWVAKRGFQGPMIACSTDNKEEQLDAGCNYSAQKQDAPRVLKNLLESSK